MSKRLIIILALAFVVGFAFTAYAEVQNVKVSGDLTVYGIMRELKLDEHYNKDQELATITRVKIDADLTDNVSTTVRLLNERYWGDESENNGNSGNSTDVSLDLAYVTLKEFLYSPATLTVGRQVLRFGNGMIVGDIDTNGMVNFASNFSGGGPLGTGIALDPDLSARKAFDAIRLNLNYDPLVIDIVAAKVLEGDPILEDDGDLYGINANYALSKLTTLEGYWWQARAGKKMFGNNKNWVVNVFGGRLVTQPIENLTYQLEAAFQVGKYHEATAGAYVVNNAFRTSTRNAWALETALAYDFKKVKYSPTAMACYAYFSGENDADFIPGVEHHYGGWDPMFEDQKFGDIANAQFPQTNAHIVGLQGTMKPVEDILLKAEYYAYWWAKRYRAGQTLAPTLRGDAVVMNHNAFVGQELDITATYNYTEDVQFGLLGGVFWPGKAFNSRTDVIATEVIGSMKVTF